MVNQGRQFDAEGKREMGRELKCKNRRMKISCSDIGD